MRETDRRREKQRAYNEEHGITPTTIKRNIGDIIAHVASKDGVVIDIGEDKPAHMVGHNLRAYIQELEKRIRDAAADVAAIGRGESTEPAQRVRGIHGVLQMALRWQCILIANRISKRAVVTRDQTIR